MKNNEKWNYLNHLYEMQTIAYIDLAFAKQIFPHDEEMGALLCYLLLALRSGHLCVYIDDEKILPKLQDLIEIDDHFLQSLIIKGSRKISKNCHFIKQFDCLFYLKKNWSLETNCIESILKLLQDTPEIPIFIQQLPNEMNEEQKQAILTASNHCLTLICGGPGTGKTYTAGHLISLLLKESNNLEIALTAPTGKAAANLQLSIQRFVKNKSLNATTLHSLLKVNRYRTTREATVLDADVILVDESSMIDAQMMVRLLSSVKTGARLILLGDPNQLPPVESGHLFQDMIAYLSRDLKVQNRIAKLKTCLRAEENELLEIAENVQRGQCQAVLHSMTQLGGAICLIDQPPHEFIFSQFLFLKSFKNENELLKKMNQFRALSPFRKGEFGSEQINRQVLGLFTKKRFEYFPIILTQNARELNLYNGDTGILVKKGGVNSGGYALFEGENASVRKISLFLLPRYEYAYCLSIHKSQGSEYHHVFLIVPDGAELFGRQSLYTAITRTKKRLSLWGSPCAIKKMIEKTSIRISGLEKRLLEPV